MEPASRCRDNHQPLNARLQRRLTAPDLTATAFTHVTAGCALAGPTAGEFFPSKRRSSRFGAASVEAPFSTLATNVEPQAARRLEPPNGPSRIVARSRTAETPNGFPPWAPLRVQRRCLRGPGSVSGGTPDAEASLVSHSGGYGTTFSTRPLSLALAIWRSVDRAGYWGGPITVAEEVSRAPANQEGHHLNRAHAGSPATTRNRGRADCEHRSGVHRVFRRRDGRPHLRLDAGISGSTIAGGRDAGHPFGF